MFSACNLCLSSTLRTVAKTCQPARLISKTQARPIPLDAPVITTDLLESDMTFVPPAKWDAVEQMSSCAARQETVFERAQPRIVHLLKQENLGAVSSVGNCTEVLRKDKIRLVLQNRIGIEGGVIHRVRTEQLGVGR